MRWLLVVIGSWLMNVSCLADDVFTLERKTDSLYVLTLTTDPSVL